jgi:predicted ribosome quality control (RQC) complex YloA/Tae2 family protein
MKSKRRWFKMRKDKFFTLAENYQNRAKETEKLSEKYNSMDKRVPFTKIKTQGDVSDAYLSAAEKWNNIGEYKKALKDYEVAFKYAYNREIQEKIKNHIKTIENKISKNSSSLENLMEYLFGRRLVYLIISIFCFISAIFFFYIKLNGYVINDISSKNSSVICLFLFSCGLIFSFFSLKNKK